jgi:hypothetical protein
MFGNFLGFRVGTEGSRGGYVADGFHQLQTLDQLAGRPSMFLEAGEAKRKETTIVFLCYYLYIFYPTVAPCDMGYKGIMTYCFLSVYYNERLK